MKFIIVFAALFAVALAAPAPVVEIVSQEVEVLPESYHYAYATSDGVSAASSGHVKNVGAENEALSVTGHFTYVGDDGVTYTVNYVADENGFQPEGAHLPVV